MPRLVMKFGGTSVADLPRIRNVAAHVKREIDAGSEVAVALAACDDGRKGGGTAGHASGRYDRLIGRATSPRG